MLFLIISLFAPLILSIYCGIYHLFREGKRESSTTATAAGIPCSAATSTIATLPTTTTIVTTVQQCGRAITTVGTYYVRSFLVLEVQSCIAV